MWKLIPVAIAFCFMFPTASLAQNPIASMAKDKSGSLWCFFLPQTCQKDDREVKAEARFRRGHKVFEATPVEVVPAD